MKPSKLTNIDPELIDELRNIRIELLVGVKQKNTTYQFIRCPLHNERTPSFIIDKDNHYHCFGCGKHGNNAIDFVMELGYDFREAVVELMAYL